MKNSGKEASIASAIFFLLSGPILWAGHLFLVYAVQSVSCAIGSPSLAASGLVQAAVVLATLSTMLLLLLPLCFPRRVAQMLRYETADRQDRAFAIGVARLLSLPALGRAHARRMQPVAVIAFTKSSATKWERWALSASAA